MSYQISRTHIRTHSALNAGCTAFIKNMCLRSLFSFYHIVIFRKDYQGTCCFYHCLLCQLIPVDYFPHHWSALYYCIVLYFHTAGSFYALFKRSSYRYFKHNRIINFSQNRYIFFCHRFFFYGFIDIYHSSYIGNDGIHIKRDSPCRYRLSCNIFYHYLFISCRIKIIHQK